MKPWVSSEYQQSEWTLETNTVQFLGADKMWRMTKEREIKEHYKALYIQDQKNDYSTKWRCYKGKSVWEQILWKLSFRHVESDVWAKGGCSVRSSKFKTEAQIYSPGLRYRWSHNLVINSRLKRRIGQGLQLGETATANEQKPCKPKKQSTERD